MRFARELAKVSTVKPLNRETELQRSFLITLTSRLVGRGRSRTIHSSASCHIAMIARSAWGFLVHTKGKPLCDGC